MGNFEGITSKVLDVQGKRIVYWHCTKLTGNGFELATRELMALDEQQRVDGCAMEFAPNAPVIANFLVIGKQVASRKRIIPSVLINIPPLLKNAYNIVGKIFPHLVKDVAMVSGANKQEWEAKLLALLPSQAAA